MPAFFGCIIVEGRGARCHQNYSVEVVSHLHLICMSPYPVSGPRYRCLVHMNWALISDRPLHAAPFQVGPRNLICGPSIHIQLDISVPRVAHTHEAPGLEGEREPLDSSLPPSKIGLRTAIDWRPARSTRTTTKPANTTGDIARFFLLFQGDHGIQRPYGNIINRWI